jgi:hypothetical protein
MACEIRKRFANKKLKNMMLVQKEVDAKSCGYILTITMKFDEKVSVLKGKCNH